MEVPTRVVLAPMAGVSVQAFRRQGRRYGAGLVCSEMVSCAGIEHRNERTLGYLRVASDEHPLAIQIFGSEPRVMAEAARMVEAAGADVVDMNFGCPVRKVTKTGAGAHLLDDPALACRITEAVASAVSVPVTVKMRRGVENGSRTCLAIGPQLVEAGAAAQDRRALRYCVAHLLLDVGSALLGGQRADIGAGDHWVADPQRRHLCDERLRERVVDVGVHDEPLCRDA